MRRVSDVSDVRTAAVRYLGMRPRTKQQVIKYLRQKGFPEEGIAETVAELEEYKYIDDFSYSVMYFRYGFEKGRGVMRIRRELSEKGVGSDVIDMAYEELEEVPDQYETARKIAMEMIRDMDMEEMEYDEKRRIKARIGRRLAGRGFPSDVIYKVLDSLL